MIKDKLNSVRERIKEAAVRSGRSPSEVILVCVTKEVGSEEAKEAIRSGITDIGENKIQDTVRKYELLNKEAGIRWHLIGHLQTNKVKKAVQMFDLIHSVDSPHLAERIQKEAQKLSKIQSILVEVNVSGEDAKYGIAPENLEYLIKAISNMKNLMLLGLMTMAPYSKNPEDSRQCFRELKKLREDLSSYNCDNVDMKHLSMGMSGDFEVAIEEGADMVRIGSAIFK